MAGPVSAEPARELLRAAPASAALQERLTERLRAFPAEILRSRLVTLDTALLKPAQPQARLQPFQVEVFADTRFTAVPDRVNRLGRDMYDWIGRLQDVAHSRVVISVRGDRALGTIRAGDRLYRLQPTGDDTHAVIEIDPATFQPEAPSEAPPRVDGEPETPDGEDDTAAAEVAARARATGIPAGPIINVLVVYTNDAADADSDIELTAQNAVADANLSYEDSGIDQRLRLTGIEPLDYDEPGGFDVELSELRNRLQRPADGEMDQVHELRDRQQADVVALLVDTPFADNCGIAYIMSGNSSGFRDYAFSVTKHYCAGNLTFTHELGHNMGARHDRAVDDTDGSPFDFNHGYVDPADDWRTVMAYPDACNNCPRLGRWSNSDQMLDGEPLGVPVSEDDAADNRRTLDFTSPQVAAFRRLDTNDEDDFFGTSVAFGDFDGDGLMDMAVGAPATRWPDSPLGRIFVYKGTPHGLAAWRRLGQGGIGADEVGDRFGHSLAVGDFDGDGHDDLAVGAPFESPGGDPQSGFVFVYRGGPNGLAPWDGFGQGGLGINEEGDRFGYGLAAGDFDGDGNDDLAVGAYRETPGGGPVRSGWVFTYRGGPNGLAPWDSFGQGGIGSDEPNDFFGEVLATGDFDGDGNDDLAVGTPKEEAGDNPRSSGWVFLYQGGRNGLTPWQGFGQAGLDEDEEDDNFGHSLAVGDFDGDGRDDLAVGAPYDEVGDEPLASGWVLVYRGVRDGLEPWQDFGHWGLDAPERFDTFGYTLTAGDFDGDGRDDLAVGAPRDSASGLVFAFGGGNDGFSPWKAFGQDGIGLDEAGDRFGFTLSAGDVDDDGRDDLAVGANRERLGEPDSGAAYLYKGRSRAPLAPWLGLHQEL